MAALGCGENIIDIGCSIGNAFGDQAVNVDVKSYKEITDEAKTAHGDITIPNFVQADAMHLPFKDGSFDAAVLSEILEHVEHPVETLNEAQRVAKIVIICVPNEHAWSQEHKPFDADASGKHVSGHVRFFDRASFIQMLHESGLCIVELLDWMYAGWAYFIAIGMSKGFEKE